MRCEICELGCEITAENYGRCRMYCLKEGVVVPRYENQVSSFSIGHIEDVPILHFYPGGLALLVGTTSCNFDCSYCENSYIARGSGENLFRHRLAPEELVSKAKAIDCRNVAFTVNEPTVSFPYFLRMAKAARKVGLKSGCATNGYFTTASVTSMAEQIDFVNVSLKSIRDDFYQGSCRVPSSVPVLRNIRVLYEKGVHVEITTPITPEMDEIEAGAIAREIAAISKDIPWHIFWLLPEYKMEGGEHVPVDRLIAMRNIAKEHLNYVFVGNLVGSEWLDTVCPVCHTTIVKRLNALCCGSQLVDYNLNKGECPRCGNKIPIVGELSLDFSDTKTDSVLLPETAELTLGLLDVHGYQKLFDFKTGERVQVKSPLVSKVGDLICRRPYPGDAKTKSDTWVTDLALEMVELYRPDLVMLNYAQAWYATVNHPEERQVAFNNVFENTRRFLDKTGYSPLVIGLGGFEPVKHVIDLEDILGPRDFTISSGKYAYISQQALRNISPRRMADLSQYWQFYTKKEFLDSLSTPYSTDFAAVLGDYITIAEPGVIFKGLNSFARVKDITGSLDKFIPVHTTLHPPEDITRVAPVISDSVGHGEKVALIIVEGAGISDFPLSPVSRCRNYDGLFIYQMHEQYITLGTGIPYSESEYHFPLGNYWLQDYRTYPFSSRFHRFLHNTIRNQTGEKKSLSVGNRSILTHVCLEADISLECYCFKMHNFGTMAVFHQKALGTDTKLHGRRRTESYV